jgi:hypothetical protein
MDIDIILLTAVISTLFIVFIIAVYREFSVMENETYIFQKESGPRAGLVNFIGNLASNKSLTPEEKKVIYKAMHRNIADMESDGVYFDNSLKEIVQDQMEVLGNDEQKPVTKTKKAPLKEK